MTELSRRSFAESLALGAVASALGVSPSSLELPAWGLTENDSTSPGALAKALTRAIRAQYGSRLSSKDLNTIAGQIQSSLERAERLRKVPLANGDEPDFVFSAVPRPEPSGD